MWMRVDFRIEKEKCRCSIQTEKKVYVIVIGSMSPFHRLKSQKKNNNREWHHSARKKNCVHPTKLPLNCYNITAFDMCRPNNRAFRTSFFLTLSPSEIIATINFDNAREQQHSLKKKKKKKKVK